MTKTKVSNVKYQMSNARQPGFTVIELIVVVAIMAMLAAWMSINIAGQRTARDVKIAQNELISNFRKIQSYTLSAHNLPNGQTAQYYLMKFDLSKPSQYAIQAIFNVSSSPQIMDVETIKLPATVRLAASSPILITRSFDTIVPTQAPAYPNGCAVAAIVAPFGKVLFNANCAPNPLPASPYTMQPSDDYMDLINFVTNTSCTAVNNPPVCSASTDTLMVLTLSDTAGVLQKKILINAITGAVCPTQDGTTCQATN